MGFFPQIMSRVGALTVSCRIGHGVSRTSRKSVGDAKVNILTLPRLLEQRVPSSLWWTVRAGVKGQQFCRFDEQQTTRLL